MAEAGKRVKVMYVGKLKTNGRVFDASKKPFAFKLGRSEVYISTVLLLCGCCHQSCTGMKMIANVLLNVNLL